MDKDSDDEAGEGTEPNRSNRKRNGEENEEKLRQRERGNEKDSPSAHNTDLTSD